MTPHAVAAFYLFTPLEDLDVLRAGLHARLQRLDARGSVLLAPEGVNGTLSMPEDRYEQVLEVLRSLPGCSSLPVKRSRGHGHVFRRLKVRLKREIVTLGVDGIDPNETVGTYVAPEDWNALISDPDTLVIDTRNDYEVELGTFEGAENPHTETFGEFPDWFERAVAERKPKRVAMFCTGGIRCEKATSFARKSGVDEVYHLDGGILSYLSAVPESESLWRGDCFVFDERVALTHGLEISGAAICRACKFPVNEADQRDTRYEEGVSCPKCFDQTSDTQKRRFRERQRQVKLAEARGRTHLTGR
ncbi:MAG: rhodanese-related sulfurtransferase [Pseudomonadota bacterium]